MEWQHRPKMDILKELLAKYLDWNAETCREKLIPLLLEWDATHRNDSDVEFVVTEVLSFGTKGKQLGNQESHVIVRIQRREGKGTEDEAFDRHWLAEKAEEKWALRKSLVDLHFTDLIRAFMQKKKSTKTKKRIEDKCHKITDFFGSSSIDTTARPLSKAAPTRNANLGLDSMKKANMELDLTRNANMVDPAKTSILKFEAQRPPANEMDSILDIAIPLHKPSSWESEIQTPRKQQRVVNFDASLSKKKIVFDQPATESESRHSDRSGKRRYDDMHRQDIRQWCSPKKDVEDCSPSGPNESPERRFGSIPRRLSSLSIYSLDKEPMDEDDKMETEDADPILLSSASYVKTSTEVISLLTPNTTPVKTQGSVVDLCSCSPDFRLS